MVERSNPAVTLTTTLNGFGEVQEQKWTDTNTPSTTTDDFDYTYDADGNCLSRTNVLQNIAKNTPNANTTYSYDTFNQLSSYQDPDDGQSQSSADNALGDYSSITTNGVAQSRTYNSENELTSVSGTTLTYDANGNLTTDQNDNKYIYDAWNRLVEVKTGSTVLASYSYDALGRRIIQSDRETVGGTTTNVEPTCTTRTSGRCWRKCKCKAAPDNHGGECMDQCT